MKINLFESGIAKKLARASIAAIGLFISATAYAAGPNSDAPPNDPETERRAFKVADGFEVNLYASEPMIAKPIGINFDAKGRLWVAGSTTYPQVKPGETPNDKIYVLEDTKGVGKADKVTVFADGLFLATAVEIDPHGGVYAANSTQLLHLKDTDGDGKADEKRVVFSGFGTEDTHHVLHGFRWDYGGRLNFLQGIYIGSRIETPRGTRVGLASTLWQFRPETMDLQIYCQGLINPWGVTWDRYGQMFLTDGAGGEGVNFAPPGAQFTAAYGASRVLKGLNPGSPKYCGAQILDGRHIPDDWQGDLLTNDFRANRTVRFKLTEDGSGFSAKLMPDLITSADRAYRPVDIKMGPDGAIYIADWYNPIINHGEVDFRDPRRDHAHGRIWRVTAKGRPLVEKPKIDGATTEDLVALLGASEQWTRLQAKQQLSVRNKQEVQVALRNNIARATQVAAGQPQVYSSLLLETLWAFETIDAPEPGLLEGALKVATPQVRAAAVRIAGHWASRVPDARKWAAAAISDEFPRVRLEAIRALADIGKATGDGTVVPQLLVALDKPVDPVIDFELYQALTELKDVWLPNAGNLKFAKPEHQAYALKAVQSGAALQKIVADLKAGKIADSGKKDAYDLVASLVVPADVSILLDHANNPKVDQSVRLAALSALERAAKQRKITPSGPTPARVKKLMTDPSPAIQEIAARLAGLYKAADARGNLEHLLTAEKSTPAVRQAAAQSLADLGGESLATLQKDAAAGNPSQIRAAAITGLAVADQKSAATLAAEYLTTAKPEDDPSPVLGAFLRREGGLAALSDAALKGKKIPADTAKLALRYVQGVGVDLGPLGEVIRTSAGASGGGPVQLSPEQMKQTMDEVMAEGDPARGEAVFRSKAAGCFQCHQIGGAGGPLAPDLRAIASAPMDYIIDSILIPNKATKDGYAATTVSTKDGDLVQGIKVRENAKELVLRDNARDEIIIPQDQIKKRKEGGSLMPTGLQDGLTHQEFIDLVRFLSELGKPGPYSVPPAPLVRRWRTIAAGATEANPPGVDSPWQPVYSKVNGELPRADALNGSPSAFVQFELQSNEAGPARVLFNKTQGLAMSVNGKPVALSGQDVKIDVAKGVTTVTLKVAAGGDEPIRIESAEVQGSPARAVPVLGR